MAEHRIAFQGMRGAYGEQAVHAVFGPSVQSVPLPTFRAVFEAVAEGSVSGGVVPLENSLGGLVEESQELLLEYPMPITGEVSLRIRHCLLAPAGLRLADIERALSHPQALAQCADYLRRHGIAPVVEVNTAVGAWRIAREALPRTAAIASRAAAEQYGLTVLADGIEDAPDNTTRFIVLGCPPLYQGSRSKTSLALTLEDTPGALHRVLGAFAARGVAVVRLEPRRRLLPEEYVFCLDVAGTRDEARVREALDEAARASASFRILGSYFAA